MNIQHLHEAKKKDITRPQLSYLQQMHQITLPLIRTTSGQNNYDMAVGTPKDNLLLPYSSATKQYSRP